MWAILQWMPLIIVVLVIVGANIFQLTLRAFYALFPFKSTLDALWQHSKRLKQVFAFRLGEENDSVKCKTFTMNARELIEDAGMIAEEHAVTTPDGYVLGLQRIVVPDSDLLQHRNVSVEDLLERLRVFEDQEDGHRLNFEHINGSVTQRGRRRSSSDPLRSRHPRDNDTYSEFSTASIRSGYVMPLVSLPKQCNSSGKPAVLLMHGLMQCSEAWLVGGREHSLAVLLSLAGFDVWCGNNRGNKYSQKHTRLHSDSEEFWDFSIDEFARYDVPAMVDYILAFTKQKTLSYVGFSQGTAQCFAALALDHSLNDKLNVFVAMSPALAVRGLARSPLTALVETDLSFIYLLFGRRRMLPSSLDVQRVLSGTAWANFLDGCLMYLFGWRADQIDPLFKLQAFHHIYSYTSVKAVVHWFQIIAGGRFAMFADVPKPSLLSPLSWIPFIAGSHSEHRVSPLYDTSKITVPLCLFVGESDTLIDIPRLLNILPRYSRPLRAPATVAAAKAVAQDQFQSVHVRPSPARRRASTSSSTMQLIATVVHDALGGWGDGETSTRGPGHVANQRPIGPPRHSFSDGGTGSVQLDDSAWHRMPVYLHVEPEWEHLDSMWATSAQNRAFPLIVQLLQAYTSTDGKVEGPLALGKRIQQEEGESAAHGSGDIWARNMPPIKSLPASIQEKPLSMQEKPVPHKKASQSATLRERLLKSGSVQMEE